MSIRGCFSSAQNISHSSRPLSAMRFARYLLCASPAPLLASCFWLPASASERFVICHQLWLSAIGDWLLAIGYLSSLFARLRGSDLKVRIKQQNIEVQCPPPANSNLIFQNTLRAAS